MQFLNANQEDDELKTYSSLASSRTGRKITMCRHSQQEAKRLKHGQERRERFVELYPMDALFSLGE